MNWSLEIIGDVEPAPRAAIDRALAALPDDRPGGAGGAVLVWKMDVDAAVAALSGLPRPDWLHTRDTGVPAPLLEAIRGTETVLTNGRGTHAPPIAEYVVGSLLALSKRLPAMMENQRRRVWDPGVAVRDLHGARIGIVGLGSIGRACARLLRPFGVRLVGVSRSGRSAEEVDEVHRPEELPAILPELDGLVLAAPLTAETRGLIGRREIGLLPAGALVVNVGRGELLDEVALCEALEDGRLGGAALDVFVEEPLPPASRLWAAPNLIVSPHSIDRTAVAEAGALDLFLENLGRWVAGERLLNPVRLELGY